MSGLEIIDTPEKVEFDEVSESVHKKVTQEICNRATEKTGNTDNQGVIGFREVV